MIGRVNCNAHLPAGCRRPSTPALATVWRTLLQTETSRSLGAFRYANSSLPKFLDLNLRAFVISSSNYKAISRRSVHRNVDGNSAKVRFDPRFMMYSKRLGYAARKVHISGRAP